MFKITWSCEHNFNDPKPPLPQAYLFCFRCCLGTKIDCARIPNSYNQGVSHTLCAAGLWLRTQQFPSAATFVRRSASDLITYSSPRLKAAGYVCEGHIEPRLKRQRDTARQLEQPDRNTAVSAAKQSSTTSCGRYLPLKNGRATPTHFDRVYSSVVFAEMP